MFGRATPWLIISPESRLPTWVDVVPPESDSLHAWVVSPGSLIAGLGCVPRLAFFFSFLFFFQTWVDLVSPESNSLQVWVWLYPQTRIPRLAFFLI